MQNRLETKKVRNHGTKSNIKTTESINNTHIAQTVVVIVSKGRHSNIMAIDLKLNVPAIGDSAVNLILHLRSLKYCA